MGARQATDPSTVRLFLGGDAMLGRGVDQALPRPGDPRLREPAVRDARAYVALAEEAHGAVPRPVDDAWPWGVALDVLDEADCDARVVNLETSVTRRGAFAPGKSVHYRMHPDNLPCLAALAPDLCGLANNHVLDFGPAGLEETLTSLSGAGLRAAGAGRDLGQARRPGVIDLGDGRRVVVHAVGEASSGIPGHWAATARRPGVHWLPAPTLPAAREIAARARRQRRPGDIVVVSVHWGSNWGHGVPMEQVRFARALVDGGVDVVHGHSSHHPRPVEAYRGKLILYGCGDLVNDYEGIRGHEAYRGDLRLLHLASVEAGTGRLAGLRMVPLRARRLRLEHAPDDDRDWLRSVLDRGSRDRGARVVEAGGALALRWG